MASSTTVRVPTRVYEEVSVAARIMGQAPGDLIAEAWGRLKVTPGFVDDLTKAQQALGAGNIDDVTDLMIKRAAQAAANRIQTYRKA